MIETFQRKPKIDINKLYGEVVSEDSKFILLSTEYDFQFNGYVVIRKKDITKRYHSDSNDYCLKISKKEGLHIIPPKSIKNITLGSWRNILLQINKSVVIIQDELKTDFWIGKVSEMMSRHCKIRHFDGVGKWMGYFPIQYKNITIVKFGGRYETLHGKYLPDS